jgi:galactose-1-phosphate uridylyltransferase
MDSPNSQLDVSIDVFAKSEENTNAIVSAKDKDALKYPEMDNCGENVNSSDL